jgi:hypothetical protein
MKNILELKGVDIPKDYRKKWNAHEKDFCHLYKNGEKVSDTLYRIGGFGVNLKNDYFLLLKHVEAFYSKDILKMSGSKDAKHLDGRWCILDNSGKERVVFDSHKSPYLQGGQIYSLDSNYYNIETGKRYCQAYTSIHSKRFLFLDNKFDPDETKRGVLKINKADGTFELFQ